MTCLGQVLGPDGADCPVGGRHVRSARRCSLRLGRGAEGGRACWPQPSGVYDSLGSSGYCLAATGDVA